MSLYAIDDDQNFNINIQNARFFQMKRALIGIILALVLSCTHGLAQPQTPRYTFNIGGGPGFPQGDISTFANVGGNFVVGGGANLGHMLGFDGEFMWHDLPPKQSIIALTGAPSGAARLYSVTGNLIAHSPEPRRVGGYLIGGIGWYHRSWELTRPTVVLGTVCLPSYFFWGVACSNGLVQSTAVLRSGSTDGPGLNVGGGLTYRLGETHAKFYTELRYHYAWHSGVNTEVLPLTFGFRW